MTVVRIADRLLAERRSGFVGREPELVRLSAALDEQGPVLTFVLGFGGIGKSSLLEAFAARIAGRAIPVRRVDCRAVEPTPAGLLEALADLVGAPLRSPAGVADGFARLGSQVVLTFDDYEVFRLLDDWLRRELLPRLPSTVKVFAFGRHAPVDAWTADPGWARIVQAIRLGPLDEASARLLLESHGVASAAVPRLLRFTQGHPLALRLAARTLEDRPDQALAQVECRPAVEVLAPMFLQEVSEEPVRRLLEAGCLVRRATRSVLASMVPDAFQEQAFQALRGLPFVEGAADGLVVHETVRAAIATALCALEPMRYRTLRCAAWARLRAELDSAPRAQLWRYTADMLYLVDRPEIRDAFFPAEGPAYSVEAASRDDWPAIRDLARTFDGAAATSIELWWESMPRAFRVARDPSGRAIAFYTFALASEVQEAVGDRDPLVGRWFGHLRGEGVPLDRPIFFCRRILAEGTGEAPAAPTIACWLDVKRAYLEHPSARRIYVGSARPEALLAVIATLGFRAPPELPPSADTAGFGTLVLDFGPEGVLGWLSRIVDAQFAPAGPRLDLEARALRLNEVMVPLTKLEFGVMRYLDAHRGRVVTRDELLLDVWGQSFGGSNVVDAVVKTLRKKLGAQGHTVETVIGHGYRLSGL